MSKSGLVKATRQGAVEAKPLQPDLGIAIERGADLGGGYYLLQLRGALLPVKGEDSRIFKSLAHHLQQLPKISAAEIIDLLAHKTNAPSPFRNAPGSNEEFLAQFEQKELQRRSQLEKKGILIDSQMLAERMGVTRQAINKAEAELRLFSLDGVSGEKLYPAFFADAQIDRRHLQKISKALERLAGASKWQFFTNPRLSLGKKTPVEALRKGKFDQVLSAAIAFREA